MNILKHGINVWVLCELSECKKWGHLDSLGVVGTLGIQKMGKTWIVWVLWELSEFKKVMEMNSYGFDG